MQLDPAIELILRCAFFALFATTLAHKAFDFASFRSTVAAYLRGSPLATAPIVLVGSIAIMLGEAVVVTACAAPVDHAVRAGVTSGMLLLYAAAMGVNLLRGNTLLDCGCNWGSLRQAVGYPLVWRNLLMALVALAMAIPVSTRPLQAIDVITVAAGTVLATLVYAGANRMLASAPQPYGTR